MTAPRARDYLTNKFLGGPDPANVAFLVFHYQISTDVFFRLHFPKKEITRFLFPNGLDTAGISLFLEGNMTH